LAENILSIHDAQSEKH